MGFFDGILIYLGVIVFCWLWNLIFKTGGKL